MFVTTTNKPKLEQRERAQQVGGRCGLPYVPRRGTLPAMLREHGCTLAYIVGRERDALRSADDSLFVHPGMFALKQELGRTHPFVRAVVRGGEVHSLLDGTVGLAGDALHLAAVLDVDVRGIEGSPIVASLLDDGLARMSAESSAVGLAARRVTVECADAVTVLSNAEPGSVDVVVLDPMFPVNRSAAPGFPLLRAVAHVDSDANALLDAARRVARRHVVLKVPKRPVIPACDDRVDGKALRYLIYEARACNIDAGAQT